MVCTFWKGTLMGKYGKCARVTVDLVTQGREADPVRAWASAALSIFPDSESSRKKGCPKDAFLGLCETGIVKGITKGKYTRSLLNKKYALDAVNILKKNPRLSDSERALWDAVQGKNRKIHNSQMDVVITLWQDGLINRF
jgi:hypothetical protein